MIIPLLSILLLCTLSASCNPEMTPEQEATALMQEIQALPFYSKIESIQHLLEGLGALIQKAAVHCEANKMTAALEKIEKVATYICEREKVVQENLIAIAALNIHKKNNVPNSVSPENLEMIEQNYTRFLDFFYQDLEVMLKLLIPLMDCDTMTEEEINKLLTV